MLEKIQREGGQGICVIQNWPTQNWYAKAFHMMSKDPIYVKASIDLLRLPSHPHEIHPIWEKMNITICLLSGKTQENTNYQLMPKQ